MNPQQLAVLAVVVLVAGWTLGLGWSPAGGSAAAPAPAPLPVAQPAPAPMQDAAPPAAAVAVAAGGAPAPLPMAAPVGAAPGAAPAPVPAPAAGGAPPPAPPPAMSTAVAIPVPSRGCNAKIQPETRSWKPLRWLFLQTKDDAKERMDPFFHVLYTGAKVSPHVAPESVYWGPGMQGYDNSKSLKANLKSKYGDEVRQDAAMPCVTAACACHSIPSHPH